MRQPSSAVLLVLVAALLAAAPGCKSSAPYTVPAAAINTALAAGFSAKQRSEGGCYAACTPGTACNPRTGYCEPQPAACGRRCQSWELCVEDATGQARCIEAPSMTATQPRPAGAGELAPGIGVSPATGTVPTLPPEKASPDRP